MGPVREILAYTKECRLGKIYITVDNTKRIYTKGVKYKQDHIVEGKIWDTLRCKIEVRVE